MSAAALGACATAPETGEAEDALDTMSEASDRHDMPTRAMAAARPEQGKLSLGGSSGIYYFGGPLMVKGTNLHYIWYVSWAGNTAPTILTDFASSLGGSSYWNINTTYSNGANVHVPNQVAFADSATVDGYPYGTSLSDSQILQIVKDHLGTGTPDPNGIYFVLTSADVTASSGFCTKYCGWHKHASINGVDTKYSFVGNPDRCPSACAAQTTGPNGNAGADGMASVIAHEAEEATTDPDLNAWFDFRGNENADKCAWTFGTTYTASNGAKANMHLGSRDFLIQRNWVNAGGGYCALKY
jgi:hypothetical protein